MSKEPQGQNLDGLFRFLRWDGYAWAAAIVIVGMAVWWHYRA